MWSFIQKRDVNYALNLKHHSYWGKSDYLDTLKPFCLHTSLQVMRTVQSLKSGLTHCFWREVAGAITSSWDTNYVIGWNSIYQVPSCKISLLASHSTPHWWLIKLCIYGWLKIHANLVPILGHTFTVVSILSCLVMSTTIASPPSSSDINIPINLVQNQFSIT